MVTSLSWLQNLCKAVWALLSKPHAMTRIAKFGQPCPEIKIKRSPVRRIFITRCKMGYCVSVSLLTFLLTISAAAGDKCYWPDGRRATNGDIYKDLVKCQFGDGCCNRGDTCLGNGICHDWGNAMTYRGLCSKKDWSNTWHNKGGREAFLTCARDICAFGL